MTLEMLEKCFGNDALKKRAVYQWHERFTNGRESINDDDRSGRPSTLKTDANVDKVQRMLSENRKLTIRELADDLHIAYGSVQDIIVNDLGLRRAIIKRIITGDETWVYEYGTQSRHQASEWRLPDEPKPKKPRRFQSKKKVMLKVFIDYNGIVHHEILPEKQTVNKEYYLDVMRRLREAIRYKRKDLWKNNTWMIMIMHCRTMLSLSMSTLNAMETLEVAAVLQE
ncbi:uncharacterized protein LOC117169795 [Belonocnema kinseyi]|uniref:uncharacterized protein LOC117169795 n=1 Tax=Belonocnema kinseyi TaxID=2817044 RepID=UPI00143DD308|nr:uncharacterized protein LOC117169795 [Belonocnema kinseyi]